MTEVKREDRLEHNVPDDVIGFSIAIVFLGLGLCLFFFSSSFGIEFIVKILAAVFSSIGVIGLGLETAKKIENKAFDFLGIGLGIVVFATMIGTISDHTLLNIFVLFVVALGALFILISVMTSISFFKTAKEKKIYISSFYKIILAIGHLSGAVLSIYKLIEALSKF